MNYFIKFSHIIYITYTHKKKDNEKSDLHVFFFLNSIMRMNLIFYKKKKQTNTPPQTTYHRKTIYISDDNFNHETC